MFCLSTVLLAAGIVSIADLNRVLVEKFEREQTFSLTATVVSVSDHPKIRGYEPNRQRMFHVFDGTDYTSLSQDGRATSFPLAGDVVRFDGRLVRERYGWNNPRVERFEKTGTAPLPSPRKIEADELQNPAGNFSFVRMEGVLTDIRNDDVDKYNAWLFLRGRTGCFIASVGVWRIAGEDRPSIGDRVELIGSVSSVPSCGRRHFQSAKINVGRVRVLEPTPSDPFSVPDIADLDYVNAAALERLSLRKADGMVTAVLPPRILLRTAEGRRVGAELRGTDFPAAGDVVSAVGFPSTDMFILQLESAVWRPSTVKVDSVSAVPVTMREIVPDQQDRQDPYTEYHGRRIRLHGRILESERDDGLILASDGRLVTLRTGMDRAWMSKCRAGSEVEVSGVCILMTESWSSRNPMPKIRGVELFVAGPEDIRILSEPSWWTVRRTVFAALGFSLVVLLALLVVSLRARVVKARARLKAQERTRLAAEIHDSLSQNLSGVAGQIAAVRRALVVKPTAAGDYLEQAERMLSSSRTELQRCLFDLRGTALEETNLGEAVRRTVEPLLGSVGLRLRFNVPRTKIGDSALHAVLCIVRELVSNGIVHGRAANVRIAGALDEEALRFSVTDDGIGFDAASAPGLAEGHFGLQGIRERLNRLEGKLSFSAVSPRGCSATVFIPRKGLRS